jgi:hypothetical protein
MLFTAMIHLVEALLALKDAPLLAEINIINDAEVFQWRTEILWSL